MPDMTNAEKVKLLVRTLKNMMWVENYESSKEYCRGCFHLKRKGFRHAPTCPINNALRKVREG